MTYFTRAEYMTQNLGDAEESFALHRNFWAQFVDASTIAHVVSHIGADVLAGSEYAMHGGDRHLNDINTHNGRGGLPNWDRAGMNVPKACKAADVGLVGYS
jgi:hypothetical protein